MSNEITRTDLAIVGICKCGSCVVFQLFIGGIAIDEETTNAMAEIYNEGGEIKIINCKKEKIVLQECKCILK